MDGMDNGHHKFTNRRSWGPVGVPCLCKQYEIGGRFFSILATYAFNGFRDWNIIEGTTTSNSVVSFMINKVAMNKNANDILIFDNASVNVARNSLDAIEQVFNGLWKRLPPYSPQFNPIELGFSNIREYVQANNGLRSVTDPIGLLNEAFNRYSEHDQRGRAAANGNWSIYVNNHDWFLRHGNL